MTMKDPKEFYAIKKRIEDGIKEEQERKKKEKEKEKPKSKEPSLDDWLGDKV